MKKVSLFMTLALVLFLAACVTPPEPTPDPIPSYDQETFSEVFDHLLDNHYKQLDEDALWEGAIQGVIDSLDDPYTRYLDAAEFAAFQDSLGESYTGIGVLVENIDDTVVIRQVFENSPAERAGILPGDTVTHVDGEDFREKTYFDTVSVITGPEGTDVEIGGQRSGLADTLYLTMTRARIDNPSVVVDTFEQNGQTIGYIEVSSFGAQTFFLFNSYLATLEVESDIDALVIDLRNNGGGYLSTVNNMLNMFLTSDGLPMFQIEQFENGERTLEEYYADNMNQKEYPIVTLVNEFSASASEVFAAGMIEAGGYDVLGMPTFGKGTMQVPESLSSTNGDELQASVGRWLTPEGNWINADGGDFTSVNPTILVEQNPFFDQFSIYLAPGETLEFDQVSLKIENAQGILSALGYDLRTDGYFDAHTETIVETYQAANNLPVTGIIDADTAASLSADLFTYKQNPVNDVQLQAAIDHLSE